MARRAFLGHFQNITHCTFKCRAEELFEKGDKNGKLLAYLAANARMHTAIPCIYSSGGTLVRDGESIMQAFVSYYSELFAAIPRYDSQVLTHLLGSLQIPELPGEVAADLEAPFTAKELASAIASFPNGKSPGPDRIPAEWYKAYLDMLSPRLLQLYGECFEAGSLLPSFYEAHVVLLPKPDKDPLYRSSYRPIALLNMDLKILTKMVANRLMKILDHLISPDQTGFKPKKATDINIHRVYTNTQIDGGDIL